MSAPQVTPADVEAVIASEHYFTGAQGCIGNVDEVDLSDGVLASLDMLTICVLITRNGHTVTGEAYCADPAKFNAETGRIEARKEAINKLWPMVVYAERERLSAGSATLASLLASEIECSVFEGHVSPVLERHGLSGLPVPTTCQGTNCGASVNDAIKWTGERLDARNVGSDVVGHLIIPPGEPIRMARSLSSELMDCVDRLGSEADTVDPRVWDHLLIYAPKDKLAAQ